MQIRTLILAITAATALVATSLAVMPSASAADSSSGGTDAVSKKQERANNRALSHSVRQSLTHVKGLDSSHINVLAHGGSITLKGTVPDSGQIDSAAGATRKVAGVSSVDNRLTVGEAGN
ncbi:BON domain-containing protein [Caballeronia insecticola]|uniref:Transport-associated protein n=1 Tax=Caballeronia insecticola TaxID=758793 RepID=R4WT90_9BURK|nr:BON domain-containing protein [Caballeronia insecticola]BAN27823.1 transport-associated protein [Caballeronia insecticola]